MQLITAFRSRESNVYWPVYLPPVFLTEVIAAIREIEPGVERIILEVTL